MQKKMPMHNYQLLPKKQEQTPRTKFVSNPKLDLSFMLLMPVNSFLRRNMIIFTYWLPVKQLQR